MKKDGVDKVWTPCGLHMDCPGTSTPFFDFVWTLPGVHMESLESTWSPPGHVA